MLTEPDIGLWLSVVSIRHFFHQSKKLHFSCFFSKNAPNNSFSELEMPTATYKSTDQAFFIVQLLEKKLVPKLLL